MKATELLEQQHREVEAIFDKIESSRSGAEALVKDLANKLAGHMAIEQKLFYPAVRSADEKIVLESFEEHAIAELALKRLLAVDAKDPTFRAKVTALKELIQHHVEEEEEELFPKVEKALEGGELERLGAQMKDMFEEVVEEGYQSAVPKGTRTSADAAERRVFKPASAAASGKQRQRASGNHRQANR
jgi:iron-sulfur cluster repair protein YtfE (RIC family)